MTLRPAKPEEVEALLAITREGFETYREFAPDRWEPPEMKAQEVVAIEDVAIWLVADGDDGEPVGHVVIIPASRSRVPVDDPKLAHFMQLFVRRTHWGTGIAKELHDAAMAEAARRGFEHARLVTPAQQARARRFYEREGWAVHGAPFHEPALALELVEYRRALG